MKLVAEIEGKLRTSTRRAKLGSKSFQSAQGL